MSGIFFQLMQLVFLIPFPPLPRWFLGLFSQVTRSSYLLKAKSLGPFKFINQVPFDHLVLVADLRVRL